tara:strand:+ start:1038 stop:1622 length:585 start_codon:yes stop_codon:yes gene_type:complete
MDIFDGRISSCGFSSGNRIVVGDWKKSPLGPFTNVMWAKPDGTRVLLSPSEEHADYVSALYNFEEVHVVPIQVNRQRRGVEIVADSLNVSFEWKRGFGIPFSRPKWIISTIEQWVAGAVFGTKTHGLTCNGLREWYCIYNLSSINHAKASYEGEDLGVVSKFEVDACFGFSEPPKKPSSVRLRSMIESGSNRRV